MGFRRPASTLVAGLCIVGVAALLNSALAPARDLAASVLYALLALLASSQRLRMHPRVGTMSLGFLFVLAALFQCGIAPGIGAAMLSALGGLLFASPDGRRQGLGTTLHAAGTLAVAAWAAGAVFGGLAPTGQAPWELTRLLLPAAAAVTVYHAISILGVSAVSVLAGYGLPKRWLREALWMVPVYFAGGAAALAIGVAYREFGVGVFVLGLPIIYVLQRSYAIRADRTSEQLRHLEERTQASEKLAQLYMSVVEALSAAVEAKDQGTRLHVRRVQSLARAVGRRVGLEGEDLQAVETAAVLHDIGKLAVPDHILSKPSRLTDRELELVKTHPAVGEAILRPIDFGADVGSIVRHHHEKMDGSGYPDGLVGDAIPMGARVLGAIDVYDALVSDRPYRQAWRAERAIEYLRQHSGTAFDPNVVEALVETLHSGELGEEEASTEADGAAAGLVAAGSAGDLAAVSQPSPQEPQTALGALVEELACRPPVHTCVAYELDERNAEVAVVAAAGEYADAFGRLRTPVGIGPSGTAAWTGRVVVGGSAVADVAGVSSDPPEGLTASMVAAVPVAGPSGRTRVVVSLYTYLDAEPPDALLAEAAAGAVEAIAPADPRARVPGRDDEYAALLEYAAFLAALSRSVTQARQVGERVVVMAVGLGGVEEKLGRELLLDLAQELRLCGRGRARVVERENAGEIVLILPPAVEAAARECVQAFEAAARTRGRCTDTLRVSVGAAVFPGDAESAHGLICIAEMRMAQGGEATLSQAPDRVSASA